MRMTDDQKHFIVTPTEPRLFLTAERTWSANIDEAETFTWAQLNRVFPMLEKGTPAVPLKVEDA
jgi:hypothetical protein